MPFKFFSTGQVCSAILILIFSSVAIAQLDWDDDVVVFGSESNEIRPSLVQIGNGQFRSVCQAGSQFLRMRRSQIHGEAWGVSDDLFFPVELQDGFRTVSDNQYAYIWDVSGGVWRISNSQNEWPDENSITVFPDRSTMFDISFITDTSFDPVDTYIHGFAAYRDNLGYTRFGYCRSEDRVLSIAIYRQIDSLFLVDEDKISVAGAYTWADENERLWAAISLDRPGTTDEQVTLYYSDDLGQSWSNRITPDSSSYEQLNPTLLGYEETIMLAYERRNSASVAHDIYFAYSPDNGESWSDPLQLTDHAFDDMRPELEISVGTIGLFYARLPVQQELGQLLSRQSSVEEPWVWEPETAVSETAAFVVSEGYSAVSDDNGFAAVWSGRLVGEDGDIFFDASWRGTSVNEQPQAESPRALFTQNSMTGRIEYELPRGARVKATLYDMLGRTVSQSTLSGSRGIWTVPEYLPSGTYLLSAQSSPPLKIQIAR